MSECISSLPNHLKALAECHARVFPDALVSRMGGRCSEKMLEWYIADNRGVLFHIEEDGRVIGYCGAIRVHEPGKPGAFTSISQHAFPEFVKAYIKKPWLLLDGESRRKRALILKNIAIRLGLMQASSPASTSVVEQFQSLWGLVVVGVDPAYHSRGCGGALMQEFERLAATDGVSHVQLSVKSENDKAIGFYERKGWCVSQHLDDSLVMQKRL
jgi:GNAT superfamily N-acetyltransferase